MLDLQVRVEELETLLQPKFELKKQYDVIFTESDKILQELNKCQEIISDLNKQIRKHKTKKEFELVGEKTEIKEREQARKKKLEEEHVNLCKQRHDLACQIKGFSEYTEEYEKRSVLLKAITENENSKSRYLSYEKIRDIIAKNLQLDVAFEYDLHSGVLHLVGVKFSKNDGKVILRQEFRNLNGCKLNYFTFDACGNNAIEILDLILTQDNVTCFEEEKIIAYPNIRQHPFFGYVNPEEEKVVSKYITSFRFKIGSKTINFGHHQHYAQYSGITFSNDIGPSIDVKMF